MNGSALDDQNLNWNIQESETDHGVGNGGYASLDYQGTYGRVNAAYSYDQNQHRVNYGIDGGIVVHANGITLSRPWEKPLHWLKRQVPAVDTVTRPV